MDTHDNWTDCTAALLPSDPREKFEVLYRSVSADIRADLSRRLGAAEA